jgi:hypothetical protein
MSRRFRWTRKRYRHAHHLVRLLNRFGYIPDMPRIVERYEALWDEHRQAEDPLLRPLRWRLHNRRYGDDDDIPF